MTRRRPWLGSLMLASMWIALSGTGGCSGGDDSANAGNGDGGAGGDASSRGDGASSDGAASSGDASQPSPDASTMEAMSTISGWMDSCLPYGNPTGTFRTT